jgi:hypothetical protein
MASVLWLEVASELWEHLSEGMKGPMLEHTMSLLAVTLAEALASRSWMLVLLFGPGKASNLFW